MENYLPLETFLHVEMRIGTIIDAQEFPEAYKPAYKLWIDFGSKIGIKKSSAQITVNYKVLELIGKQIIAVINLPKKQVASFMSECLVLGSTDKNGNIILLSSDYPTVNGVRVY